jgi:hypothetical protein
MSLIIKPIELKDANELVSQLHRHHKPAVGHRFSIGAYDTNQNKFVGAAIVGRPVARMIDKSKVLEVTRLVTDGTKNACSLLYSASARVAKELGYEKIQTYILDTEPGTSLIASGWIQEYTERKDGVGWNNRDGRRSDQPIVKKQRWAKVFRKIETESEN